MGLSLSTIFTTIAGVGFLVFLASIVLMVQGSKNPELKAASDRALLKELLEGFELEIPSELNDPNATVVKQIKTP